MFRDRNHLKAILRSVFKRYVSGNADIEEQNLVDNFYDNISSEKIIDPTGIGAEIKQRIDREIQRQQANKIRYRIYIPAAACLMVLFLGAYFYKSYFDADTSTRITHSIGPSVKIGQEHFLDLQNKIPTGSYFETEAEAEILHLENVFQGKEREPVVIDNASPSMFSVSLSDGSRVRLSPHARITFGPDFNENSRSVYVEGEVYFDIAKQTRQEEKIPFIVETSMQTIEVLSTQFLVDAHASVEENVQLHEGRIKLKHNYSKREVVLHPGQQAFVDRDRPQIYVAHVGEDDKINAWRNGLFYFEGQTIGTVMRELSNWYNIGINVDNRAANLKISGTFTRYEKPEDVLELIQMTNKIRFYEKKGVVYVSKK